MSLFGIPLSSLVLAAAVLFTANSPAFAQRYKSSVVGTDFDFITDEDPSNFKCLEFAFRGYREMPDKSGLSPLILEAFVFLAHFEDGTRVDIAVDIDFENEENARKESLRYATRLGKLPTSLRRGVERIVIHKGHEDTTAFSDEGLIVLYSDNATKRISTHDLEETLFHESVHASWDKEQRKSEGWLAAQVKDGGFLTEYAQKNPEGEDLAESALFAFTLIHNPRRIPRRDATKIKKDIPARIAFVETLLPKGEPLTFSVGEPYACDGSAKTFAVSEERALRSRERFEREQEEVRKKEGDGGQTSSLVPSRV